MSQEASERVQRCSGARLLRTTSLRTPVDGRARVLVHNGSEKGPVQTDDPAQDLGSGDTGFFDSPEDYGEANIRIQQKVENAIEYNWSPTNQTLVNV
jgi:hypothetical protein